MNELPGWPWQPDKCPADEQFIEWLDYYGKSVIFHMGTGMHHKVGDWSSANNVNCVGLTASYEEFLAADKHLTSNYLVIYADIYTLDPESLPVINIMSLFHLGELTYLFGEINEDAIINLLDAVVPGGRVLFYNRSSAWDRAEVFVRRLVEEGILTPHNAFGDLEIYQRS